jgi:uncharacterized protein YgiM (DUF1202 family)
MTRVILVTFGFLGWVWFELSGGRDFQPGQNGVQLLAAAPVSEQEIVDVPGQPEVARSGGMGMTLADVTALSQARQGPVIVTPTPQTAALVTTSLRLPVLSQGSAVQPALDTASDAVVVPVAAAPEVDYRVVTGNRVNLRNGPGTGFSPIAQLLRGQEVEILREDSSGWVKLRTLEGSRVGWMSASFLIGAN